VKVGDRVRLAGYPTRYPWMENLDGEIGTIREVDTAGGLDIPVYGVAFPGLDDLLWFGASYLESKEAA
jgi:hypothetical protein